VADFQIHLRGPLALRTRHLKPVDMLGCLCYSALFRGYSVVVVS